MTSHALPVFNDQEYELARHFLATQVAEMMGRKMEEGDWAKVYCAAKDIPQAGWSNTDIDVMHRHVGVEQKMMCRASARPIRDCCGTTLMHPAGTRAIRIPAEPDATAAARIVLTQYGELIARRRTLVSVVNRFNNKVFTRDEAVRLLQVEGGYSRSGADRRVPQQPLGGDGVLEPDLRIGWLLWQDSLREFLYFEEEMAVPDPDKYYAEWRDRPGSGSRIASRNLWIFDKKTGEKHFSVTTDAGAKIQPYFRVPTPGDPNLYYFVVQGEDCGNGFVRVWLTEVTAMILKDLLGDLTPDTIAGAVAGVPVENMTAPSDENAFGKLAVEVLVPAGTYARLQELKGVSDEHNFKLLVDLLRS